MSDIKKALYAGILVGIGDVVYTILENKYIGSMLFSLALLTVINSQLNLYTGKIGFYKNYSWRFLVKILFMNLIGILFVCAIFLWARAEISSTVLKIANAKFADVFFNLFAMGILCGMCMYIAVSNKNQLISVFSIMVFILCGFRHCIADFPFLIVSFSYTNLLKFIMIVLGNSVGSIMINFLFSDKKAE